MNIYQRVGVLASSIAGAVGVMVPTLASAQEVAASSTVIKATFQTMFGQIMDYFVEILPFLVPFILGVALLLWLWRFLMGFAHRR